MVVITGLIGAPGLGVTIIRGAREQLNVGAAFDAGIAIVILAIVIDRRSRERRSSSMRRPRPVDGSPTDGAAGSHRRGRDRRDRRHRRRRRRRRRAVPERDLAVSFEDPVNADLRLDQDERRSPSPIAIKNVVHASASSTRCRRS